MWCLTALRVIRRNRALPLAHKVLAVSLENQISVPAVESSHPSLIIFVKVRPSIDEGSGNQPANLMIIDQWSDLSALVWLQREPTVE